MSIEGIDEIVNQIANLPMEDKVEAINRLRVAIHEVSPFSEEPVDLVQWVKADEVYANDYNPNAVAPPEMELLAHSIMSDGYTQPIVTYPTELGREVVDGFHRNRVGKEVEEVSQRVHGYLPVVGLKNEQQDRKDRIAATIRHNRARGKHKIEAMSEIVIELRRRNWSPAKVGRELGMDQDEVLRLCQISGLSEMFADSEFSEAWEADNESSLSPVLEVGGDQQPDVEATPEQGVDAA